MVVWERIEHLVGEISKSEQDVTRTAALTGVSFGVATGGVSVVSDMHFRRSTSQGLRCA